MVLAIDIPIGLTAHGPRDCDILARKLLRAPRASSVFPAPVRAVLGATTYQEATSRSEAACGQRMSQQAFGILASPFAEPFLERSWPTTTFAMRS